MSAAAEEKPLPHLAPGSGRDAQHARPQRGGSLPTCSRVHEVSEITCLSCMAGQQGLNCWEVLVSPCCKRDRSRCPTCPIYVRIRKAASVAQTVSIRLKDGRCLRGQVHVWGADRLSDRLNGPDIFLAITEVRWGEEANNPHQQGAATTPVVFIARDHIASVEPVEGT